MPNAADRHKVLRQFKVQSVRWTVGIKLHCTLQSVSADRHKVVRQLNPLKVQSEQSTEQCMYRGESPHWYWLKMLTWASNFTAQCNANVVIKWSDNSTHSQCRVHSAGCTEQDEHCKGEIDTKCSLAHQTSLHIFHYTISSNITAHYKGQRVKGTLHTADKNKPASDIWCPPFGHRDIKIYIIKKYTKNIYF